MFERFDESARRALFFARYISTQENRAFIDESHLAAGVLRELSADEWRALGGIESLEEIRRKLSNIPQDSTAPVNLAHSSFTPSATRALTVAAEIADRHSHKWICRGHLLVAVVDADKNSSASQLLRAAGVDPSRIDAVVAAADPSAQKPVKWEARLDVERDSRQDDHDLRALCDRLFVATDRKDWAAARGSFADGTIDVDMTSVAGGSPVRITADQLIDGFRAGLHAAKTSHHLVTNYLTAITGDLAEITAQGYAWNRVAELAPDDLWETWGTYRFTALRTAAGWRLTRFEYHSKLTRGNDGVRTHTTTS